MTDFSSKWLVETDWLQKHLGAPGLVVLDATWAMPDEPKPGSDHYREAHIPGALFFDIEDLSDTSSPHPHMLPPPEKFASRMKKMGVGDGMKVIVYDNKGIFSSPRAWWMFRVMGHEDVAVLNGGLKKWLAEGRPVESGPPALRSARHFTTRRNSELVREISDMLRAVQAGKDSDRGRALEVTLPRARGGDPAGAAPGAYARRLQPPLWGADQRRRDHEICGRDTRRFREGRD